MHATKQAHATPLHSASNGLPLRSFAGRDKTVDDFQKLRKLATKAMKREADVSDWRDLPGMLTPHVRGGVHTVLRPDDSDAKDIYQEALWRCLQTIHELRNVDAIKTWAFRIGRRAALNHERWRAGQGAGCEKLADAPALSVSQHSYSLAAGSVLEHLEEEDRHKLVQKAFWQLKPKFRHVLHQCRALDRPVTEVAKELGEPQQTVQCRLKAALEAIRAIFGRLLIGGQQWRR